MNYIVELHCWTCLENDLEDGLQISREHRISLGFIKAAQYFVIFYADMKNNTAALKNSLIEINS